MELRPLQGKYTIYRMEKDTPIPKKVYDSFFYSVTQTNDELSVVCESNINLHAGKSEPEWVCLKVAGPLDFSLTGILADLSGCLAKKGISIFAVSTYDTDFILVKEHDLNDAIAALSDGGHTINKKELLKASAPVTNPATLPHTAAIPAPPYYAVIFTSIRTPEDKGYEKTAEKMVALASRQPGFLGLDSARQDIGVTVSYWSDITAIQAWKQHPDHLKAQKKGKALWYSQYRITISKVEKEYSWHSKTSETE